jgi:hypothetical protein
MLGYHNKRVCRLISISLCNLSKPHVSSIDLIEIHEDSDFKIERFLPKEDPNSHKLDPNQPFGYVNNLPPCLEGSKGFIGINLGQGPTTYSVLTSNYTLH